MKITVKEKRFPSAAAHSYCCYTMWIPDEVRGAVQLTHGMAEYVGRYDRFARFLAENGFLVYGQDHAGHGRSVTEPNPFGFFKEQGGWDALISDMRSLYSEVRRERPAVPFVLFGHSMGSFLARSYAARYPDDFEGFVFCGTAGSNPALKAGKVLCSIERKIHGDKFVSKLVNSLAFGPYNKPFAPNKTEFDWLSANAENVERYVNDPLCGFPFTVSAMYDLFSGLEEISDKKWAFEVPDKPVLLIAGENDPVGAMGKGVTEVTLRLKAAGKKAESILYPGLRHEILNEYEAAKVFGDVLLFLETVAADGEYVK